jgi:hypothetical protein
MTPMDRVEAEQLIDKTGTWRFPEGNVIGRCVGVTERARGYRQPRELRFHFAGIEQPFIGTWISDLIEFKESQ